MTVLTRPEGFLPEDLNLSRRAIGAMIFAGYAAAAVAADADPIVTDSKGLTTATVAIPEGGEQLPAYVARPAGPGRRGAVIVVSEVFGVHAYIQDICRRLAKQGYVAVAPAFFFRAPGGAELPTLTDFPKIMAIVKTATYPQITGDVAATLAWLKAQPFVDASKLAITGFCWGGAEAWMASARFPEFKAAVAWYGKMVGHPGGGPFDAEQRPWPIDVAKEMHAPVLGLYGGQDKGNPQTDIDAMRAALKADGKTGSEIVVYPEAQHGFHADYRPSYDAAAAQDGWKRMLAFFAANGVTASPVAA
jgi:carboxymethylenebutenolidase